MPSEKKHILCIDDDEDTCAMLSVFLGHAGFEVASAQDVGEGLTLAKSYSFDIYLLDLWLKDNEKKELFQQIRDFDSTTPIIIYSADARQATRDKLLDANVQAFLTKPEGLNDLIDTIRRLTAVEMEKSAS
jgi:DNA-binding response OmpR family regulator